MFDRDRLEEWIENIDEVGPWLWGLSVSKCFWVRFFAPMSPYVLGYHCKLLSTEELFILRPPSGGRLHFMLQIKELSNFFTGVFTMLLFAVIKGLHTPRVRRLSSWN